jgi:hypothetical protein
MVVDPILLDSIHIVSHDTKADLPIPRPDAIAIRAVLEVYLTVVLFDVVT